MAPHSSLSIVVPVYNSASMLSTLVERLEPVLSSLTHRYELILVNDGSRDSTWEVASGLAREHEWIRAIDLMRNYGQHNALLCGIREASNEVIVTLDDDLQHPPEEIPKLLDKLAEGFDVVYGAPVKVVHSLLRGLASRATRIALQHTVGADTARRVSAFRAFRTQVRDAFQGYDSYSVSIDVLLTWGTTRFTWIAVRHDPRMEGASNYTVRKLAKHALDIMTGFSTFPLQVASIVGFGFVLFGIGVLIYVVGGYLIRGYSVPGFPFLASVIAIFSGAQLFALGVIGEYLARMHFRMMKRPAYTVRQKAAYAVRSRSPRTEMSMEEDQTPLEE